MEPKPFFRIRREVSDKVAEELFIYKQELKIGSLPDNELFLKDASVGPVHAKIREDDGRFWLIDVPDSSATVLNGRIIYYERLSGGDLIQISRYFLRVDFAQGTLLISVEKKPGGTPVKAALGPTPTEASRRKDAKHLTGREGEEEETLNRYWHGRNGEAGKILDRTPLSPTGVHRIGKVRLNWRPTLDLKGPNRKRYIMLAILLIALATTVAWFAWADAYSPGSLANAHAASQISDRRIALSPVSSCSDCHQVMSRLEDNCTACHEVPRATDGSSQGFATDYSKAHREAEVGCIGCHSEHNGLNFPVKDVTSDSCTSCHNDQHRFRGKILGAPHKDPSGSPTVGYPSVGGVLTWKNLTGPEAKDRFHIDHPYASTKCGYCHEPPWGTDVWKKSPQRACQACHAVSFTTAKPIGPNCVTCHKQHGRDTDLSAALGKLKDSEIRPIVAQVRSHGLSLKDTTESFTPAAAVGTTVSFNQPITGGASVKRQGPGPRNWHSVGGIVWYAWAAPLAILAICGVALIAISDANRKRLLLALPGGKQAAAGKETEQKSKTREQRPGIQALARPHPEIDPELCIGCNACIEACPHGVLAMEFDEIASPVAPEQCMDDTACQVACPTEACIVVNTQKDIKKRPKPFRDQKTFMTNVPGVYLVGDVSRVPLIKNAINEGAGVIDCIARELQDEAPSERAEFDVAIIGAGPAGLSAAIMAKHRGLRFIVIEQNKVWSTIQAYPAGKNVSFKPDNKEAKGLLSLPSAERDSRTKEAVVELWTKIMKNNELVVHEEETCKGIRPEKDYFTVVTAKGETGEPSTHTAHKIILALGSSATPKKLGVQGEKRAKYKLSNADNYVRKRCAVVGGGNSAIEAALALVGYSRDGDPKFTRDNHVTLIVRGGFTRDLKLGNKMDLYDCWDEERIDVRFETEIKEIREGEVVLMNKDEEETDRISNDYVFVYIGSLWPEKFLTDVGITILDSNGDAAKQETH